MTEPHDVHSRIMGWSKTAEAARRYANLLSWSRVPWPDHRVQMNETVIITAYRPEPDPELASDWQRFIDSVAAIPTLCDKG